MIFTCKNKVAGKGIYSLKVVGTVLVITGFQWPRDIDAKYPAVSVRAVWTEEFFQRKY
jgi:hypothetical protein